MKKLLALVRCHTRARTLDIVLSELERYASFPGVDVLVHIAADRPTSEVWEVLRKHEGPLVIGLETVETPVVSPEHGERFSDVLNGQLEWAEKHGYHPDWIVRQDDDQWLEPLSITEELPRILHDDTIDLWYAHTAFFWGDPKKFNRKRHHTSVHISRYRKGGRFPTNRLIHATDNIHDRAIIESRFAFLRSPLLDYGAYTEDERKFQYKRYSESGRIDLFTRALVEEPDLVDFPAHLLPAGLKWIDLFSGEHAPAHAEVF